MLDMVFTHALSRPNDDKSNGDNPMASVTTAIVYGVVEVLLNVASWAHEPMMRIMQKMTRNIHPEFLLKPWR